MQSRVSKTLKKKGFEIIVGKRENGGYHFLFFPQCISILLKIEIIILATFILSSANAYHSVERKICRLVQV